MSLQNILVSNPNSLFCENLTVEGNLTVVGTINSSTISSYAANLYINYSGDSRSLGPYNFEFFNNNGLISVLMPSFVDNTVSAPVNGYYFVSLNQNTVILNNYSPKSGIKFYQSCAILNAASYLVGNISTSSSGSPIILISVGIQPTGTFSDSVEGQGLPFTQIFTYSKS